MALMRRVAGVAGVAFASLLVAAEAKGATCTIVNVTPIGFGTYHAGSPFPVDSTGEIDVSCTGSQLVQISLGPGISGHRMPRQMTTQGTSLDYNLYLDAARTMIWGDGTEGTQTFTGFVTAGQILRLPIFGRVFALQSVPRGVYIDRIIAFVVF